MKCGLYALLFTVSSIALSIFSTDVSKAYAPVSPSPWTADLSAKLDTTLSGTQFENWRAMNYATGNYDGSSFLFFVGNDEQFGMSDGGTATTFTGAVCRWDYGLNSPGCNPLSSSYSLSVDSLYSLHLTDGWQEEHQSLIDSLPQEMKDLLDEGGNPEEPYTPPCSTWDVACWFGSVIGTVTDTLASLGAMIANAFKALGEWIANLIVPNDSDGSFTSSLQAHFNSINDAMHEKLGILLFPFDALTEFGNALMEPINIFGSDTSCAGNSGVPEFCTGMFAISDGQGHNWAIGIGGLERAMPQLFAMVKFVLQVSLFFGIVYMLQHKYFSIVRS